MLHTTSLLDVSLIDMVLALIYYKKYKKEELHAATALRGGMQRRVGRQSCRGAAARL